MTPTGRAGLARSASSTPLARGASSSSSNQQQFRRAQRTAQRVAATTTTFSRRSLAIAATSSPSSAAAAAGSDADKTVDWEAGADGGGGRRWGRRIRLLDGRAPRAVQAQGRRIPLVGGTYGAGVGRTFFSIFLELSRTYERLFCSPPPPRGGGPMSELRCNTSNVKRPPRPSFTL